MRTLYETQNDLIKEWEFTTKHDSNNLTQTITAKDKG